MVIPTIKGESNSRMASSSCEAGGSFHILSTPTISKPSPKAPHYMVFPTTWRWWSWTMGFSDYFHGMDSATNLGIETNVLGRLLPKAEDAVVGSSVQSRLAQRITEVPNIGKLPFRLDLLMSKLQHWETPYFLWMIFIYFSPTTTMMHVLAEGACVPMNSVRQSRTTNQRVRPWQVTNEWYSPALRVFSFIMNYAHVLLSN